ncbi:MAG TPA: glycoside hydrolase family 3 C-terminal domain-containing protein [Clostridia bacterium]|nr:glycoside hydrolase family 3 C-terminal domain-containing protein [Clostridia bacterium]
MFNREAALAKARRLVAKMTLEEKMSQLAYGAPAIERLGVPAYNWWNEGLHGVARAGVATSFPQAIALAAMFDREELKAVSRATALEGRAKYNEFSKHGDRDIYKGLTFFSPNINIFRDPRWGRGHETLGEDPYLTAELGKAFVRGMQGEGETMTASACAKHYAVHSGPEAIRHHFNAIATQKDMWETYLPAFEALVVDAQVESVMGAYNRVNGEPCCGSKTLLVDILRSKWGFAGFVVSDCWALIDFHTGHGVTSSPEESAALAMKNGCDINCGSVYLQLKSAYDQGLITEDQVTLAAERAFTTRYLLGIMEEGSEYDKISYETVECSEHLALAQETARKSCVLLKNDGILPLNKNKLKTLGVIGPNADSRVALTGNYHGTSSRYITILEGIQDECGDDVRVLYAPGCALYHRKTEVLAFENDRVAEAVTVAEHSDTVLLVLGLDETLEGEAPDDGNSMEAGDKPDLYLPDVQRELLTRVLAVGKPTVVVLLAGSSIDLSVAEAGANAVFCAWYPGARGGKAVADLLFGKVSPSGKLPVTFYHEEDLAHLPEFTDYAMKGRTYRYLDRAPLYPFGYGLSYGDVRVLSAAAEKAAEGGLTVTATVQNIGKVATDDVVQLYIRAEDTPHATPNPILCEFARVHLDAGESKQVTLHVAPASLTVVDDAGNRLFPGGRYSLYAGTSQPDARSRALTGKSPVRLELKL